MSHQGGKKILMSGNEAMARGAIEAGVGFCASYPGTPSTEITSTLMKWAKNRGVYVEWSVNEKVALEAAAAASWVGLPALCPMKSLGLNVASDFLLNLNLSGTGDGGLVIIVCDDPQGHSSSNEQDSRFYAKAAKIPLLEPATAQEAKDIIPFAITLSQREKIPVMIRTTTRLNHTQAIVTTGDIPREQVVLEEKLPENLFNVPNPHFRNRDLQEKLKRLADEFSGSAFNRFMSESHDSQLTVVSSGVSRLYANEALQEVGTNQVSHLEIVTVFPLPQELVKRVITDTREVLFIEEVDPFLEDEIRILATETTSQRPIFHGKRDGLIRSWGEINTDAVIRALHKVLGRPFKEEYARIKAQHRATEKLIPRPLTFCAGCTHRNVYWALQKVKQRLNGQLVVTGDIGCYSLGVFYNHTMDTMQAMGSGIGTASGLGQLQSRGYSTRVATIAGDSTFFHACMPGLVNARHTNSDVMFIIVNNNTTAMTGFQPTPGSGDKDINLTPVSIKKIIEAVEPDALVSVDGNNIPALIDTFYNQVKQIGLKVIIVNSVCRLEEKKRKKKRETAIKKQPRIVIREAICKGEQCGICVKQYSCVALAWNMERGVPMILDDQCVRCGACIDVCPYGAIQREE